jgi:hypothetical protein
MRSIHARGPSWSDGYFGPGGDSKFHFELRMFAQRIAVLQYTLNLLRLTMGRPLSPSPTISCVAPGGRLPSGSGLAA